MFVEAVGGAGRPPQADDGVQFLGPIFVVAEVLVLVHAHLRPGGKQWPPSDITFESKASIDVDEEDQSSADRLHHGEVAPGDDASAHHTSQIAGRQTPGVRTWCPPFLGQHVRLLECSNRLVHIAWLETHVIHRAAQYVT